MTSDALIVIEADELLDDVLMELAGWEQVNLSACLVQYALRRGLQQCVGVDSIRERTRTKYSTIEDQRHLVLKALNLLLNEYNMPDTYAPYKALVRRAKSIILAGTG